VECENHVTHLGRADQQALSPELKRKVDAIRAQKEGSSTMKQQFEVSYMVQIFHQSVSEMDICS
jgi:hypothetical protein